MRITRVQSPNSLFYSLNLSYFHISSIVLLTLFLFSVSVVTLIFCTTCPFSGCCYSFIYCVPNFPEKLRACNIKEFMPFFSVVSILCIIAVLVFLLVY